MRTTILLDDDVAAGVDEYRRRRAIGLDDAVNELVRAGVKARASRKPFRQVSYDMGEARMDLSNIAEVLEELDGPGPC